MSAGIRQCLQGSAGYLPCSVDQPPYFTKIWLERKEKERESERDGGGGIVPSVGSCSVLDLGHIPMSV